jgi:hypothetical protein
LPVNNGPLPDAFSVQETIARYGLVNSPAFQGHLLPRYRALD